VEEQSWKENTLYGARMTGANDAKEIAERWLKCALPARNAAAGLMLLSTNDRRLNAARA
jgi:hypothetical protein